MSHTSKLIGLLLFASAVAFGQVGGSPGVSGGGGPVPDGNATHCWVGTGAWAACGAGSMIYPGAGVPLSVSGTSWGTSLTKYGAAAGVATSSDPGATAEVPMVADGTHGQKPSASGALGTAAFIPKTSLSPNTGVFYISNTCSGQTNCLQWTDDNSTDNCGTATTSFMAAINAYAGPGTAQVFIEGSGTGQAYKLSSCNLVFIVPTTLHLSATLNCVSSTANCIQFGTSATPQAGALAFRLEGGGTFIGGASLTTAGVECSFYSTECTIEGMRFINFGAGNATLGSCTNYAIQMDSGLSEGDIHDNEWEATDSTVGRCAINNRDTVGGTNTARIYGNHIGDSGHCGSVAVTEGGAHSSINDNSIFDFAMPIRVQSLGSLNVSGAMISHNSLDNQGCVPTTSGVAASVQFGGTSSSAAVSEVTLVQNNIPGGAGHETYLFAIAGDSTATISNMAAIGNVSDVNVVALAPVGILCSGTCYQAGNENFTPIINSNFLSSAVVPPSDSFVRANGGLGSNWHTVAGTVDTDVLGITSDTVGASSTNIATSIWTVSGTSTNQFSSATVSSISGGGAAGWVVVRGSASADSYYAFTCSTAGEDIVYLAAGTQHNLTGILGPACAAGQKILFTAIGSTLTGYINGVPIVSAVDANLTSGYPGLGGYTSGAALSNWSGGQQAVNSGTSGIASTFQTLSNCSSGASPALCGSAAAGSVALPTGTNPTLVVDTTAVTANSQIILTVDESLGTKLGVTCNSTLSTLLNPVVTARTAGTSFTFTIGAIIATNPACISYSIIN